MSKERIATLGLSLVGALVLTQLSDRSLGPGSLWALGFLTLVSTPLRAFMAVCVLAAGAGALLTAPWARDARSQAQAFFPISRLSAVIGILFAGRVFWSFRERTVHGDALWKLQLLSTRTLQTDPYVWKEPLDSLVTYSLVGQLRQWARPADVAVALLSVLAGMVYVSAVLYVARLLSKQTRQYVLYIVGLLALGSSQLWFGHIENYSLVTATAFATVALAIGYLHGANALWPVGLTGGLALSFHPQAAFMMPALLLLLDRRQWRRQITTLLAGGVAAPALTIVGMVLLRVPWPDMVGGYAGDRQLFWTPSEMVAPAHLWDALNNLLLVAPLTPLWIGVGLWALSRPEMRRDGTFRYLTGVVAGLLVYHFTFQNDLSRQEDWDLFAIVGPGLTLWGLYAHQDVGRRALVPALTFATVFTLAWVGVNYTYSNRPPADQRSRYSSDHVLLQDLATRLPRLMVVTPDTRFER